MCIHNFIANSNKYFQCKWYVFGHSCVYAPKPTPPWLRPWILYVCRSRVQFEYANAIYTLLRWSCLCICLGQVRPGCVRLGNPSSCGSDVKTAINTIKVNTTDFGDVVMLFSRRSSRYICAISNISENSYMYYKYIIYRISFG